MLSISQYFQETLKASDIESLDVEGQLTKIAEDSGKPLDFVKLAKQVFDMSILEGLDYETPEARWEDAVKIAEGYTTYITEERKNAAQTVDRLLEKLATVATEYAKDVGLKGDAGQLLKLAAAQVDNVARYNEKVSHLNKEAAEKKKIVDKAVQDINTDKLEVHDVIEDVPEHLRDDVLNKLRGEGKEAEVEDLPDYFNRASNEKTAGLVDIGEGAKRLLENN